MNAWRAPKKRNPLSRNLLTRPKSGQVQPKGHVTVFARAPRYGCIKKRLARDIGKYEALRFFRENVRRMIRLLQNMSGVEMSVAVTPDHAMETISESDFLKAPVQPQGPGDLGMKIAHALKRSTGRHRLIIGSDIPDIKPSHIEEAFEALNSHDVVFGPCDDGGYWLVGMNRKITVPWRFLSGVEWSTPNALEQSVATLPKRLKVAYISSLTDIDEAAEFRAWKRRQRRKVG